MKSEQYRTSDWTHPEVLPLAKFKCPSCFGLGFPRETLNLQKGLPCTCVLKAVFRICFKKYENIKNSEYRGPSKQGWDIVAFNTSRRVYGFKDQEFLADFISITRRTLNEIEFRIFSSYYLNNIDYQQLCIRHRLSKGNFFHLVYRIQMKLGQAFRSTKPYPIYPVDEYFSPTPLQHISLRRGKNIKIS